jgi:hypothetical protein
MPCSHTWANEQLREQQTQVKILGETLSILRPSCGPSKSSSTEVASNRKPKVRKPRNYEARRRSALRLSHRRQRVATRRLHHHRRRRSWAGSGSRQAPAPQNKVPPHRPGRTALSWDSSAGSKNGQVWLSLGVGIPHRVSFGSFTYEQCAYFLEASGPRELCTMHCTPCTVHCIPCTVHCIPCTVHCIQCAVHCAL